MNVSDSERIAGFLEARQILPAKDMPKADIVIFNTCGVRKMAEDRAYGQIHNLWKNNPKTKIIVTGCLANRKDIQEKLKNKVALFCEIKDFPEKISNLKFKISNQIPISNDLISKKNNHSKFDNSKLNRNSKLKIQNSSNQPCDYLELTPNYSTPHTAYVPIMTGCNNFCSYCVVPYARGREVSRPAEEILSEIKKLIKSGVKEITLLGQNVNSYKSKKYNFEKLLKKVNTLPGNFWIRFMTPHPKDMTDGLIETITSLEKVCEAVHLPIQSGADAVLKNMNRKYSRAHYLQLIEKIKKGFAKNKPDQIFSLSSDIIVGFPGETKAQLEKTAGVMRKVNYDMVFFGQFSPRPGTAAFKMKDNVPKEEKVRREKYLNEILAASALKNNEQYLKKIFPVLIMSEKNGNYFGYTRTLKNVKIQTGRKNLVGKIIDIKITRVDIWNLEGKIV